jgi:hypothetical protein
MQQMPSLWWRSILSNDISTTGLLSTNWRRDMPHNDSQQYVMYSVTFLMLLLSFDMLIFILLSVDMLNVILLSVIFLSVILPNVILLNVVWLSVQRLGYAVYQGAYKPPPLKIQ